MKSNFASLAPWRDQDANPQSISGAKIATIELSLRKFSQDLFYGENNQIRFTAGAPIAERLGYALGLVLRSTGSPICCHKSMPPCRLATRGKPASRRMTVA